MFEPPQRWASFTPLSFWLTVCLMVPAFTAPAIAQLTPGRVAVTASVPNGPDIGMSYAASENLRINLGLGFAAATPDVGPSRSEFVVRPGLWIVQKAVDNVSLFYGGALEFSARSGGTSAGDVGVLLQAGAAYSIGSSFSIGSVMGLGYSSGDTSASGTKGGRFGTTELDIVLTWWAL